MGSTGSAALAKFEALRPVYPSGRSTGAPSTATGDEHSSFRSGLAGVSHTNHSEPEKPPVPQKGSEGPRSAASPSFLDPIQINRNKLEKKDLVEAAGVAPASPLRRKRFCGRYSVTGHREGTPTSEVVVGRVNCKCWACEYCGPRRARVYKRSIRLAAEKHGLQRFVTLTLDPSKIEGSPVAYLNAVFAKFRVYLKRKCGVAPKYIRVLEFQKNGNPHLHILIDRFIEWQWIKAAWAAVGGGRFVNVKFVDVHHVSRYLSKYLSKELLLSAPLWCRRVTCARGIQLLPKSAGEWSYVLKAITLLWRTYLLWGAFISEATPDEEGLLDSFVAQMEWSRSP